MADDPALCDLLSREGVHDFSSVELEDDFVLATRCGPCSQTLPVRRRRSALRPGDGECRTCGEPLALEVVRTLDPDHELLRQPLSRLDLAHADVVTATVNGERIHLILRPAR